MSTLNVEAENEGAREYQSTPHLHNSNTYVHRMEKCSSRLSHLNKLKSMQFVKSGLHYKIQVLTYVKKPEIRCILVICWETTATIGLKCVSFQLTHPSEAVMWFQMPRWNQVWLKLDVVMSVVNSEYNIHMCLGKVWRHVSLHFRSCFQ